MQIVIDISKEDYNYLKNTSFVEEEKTMLHQSASDRKGTMLLFRLIDSIKNGTPLPKGHGRLIDADKLIAEYNKCGCYPDEIKAICEEPTVLKSDKEVE